MFEISTIDLKRYYLREKGSRFVDILVSICILIFVIPIMAFVAILVALDSPGPILFKQKRLGREGTTFDLFKFRSMYHNCDQQIHRQLVEKAIKQSDSTITYRVQQDPRITRVGRWLRKFSIEELPQFLNVLKGDMSVVGPRPLLDYEGEYFKEWYWQRQKVKPGLTGLYQVTARGNVSFDDMVKLDLMYIKNYNLWLNLKLIIATLIAVIKKTGG